MFCPTAAFAAVAILHVYTKVGKVVSDAQTRVAVLLDVHTAGVSGGG